MEYKNKFEVIKSIGKGGQGRVELCKEKKSGNFFARKVIETKNILELNKSLQEVMNMLKLNHENIVKTRLFYLDEKESGHNICIIYEFCNKSNLRDLINRFRKKSEIIDIGQILKWMEQITLGVEYIHSKKIIHRDLKPANVFLSTNKYTVKIGDFGFSKFLEESMAKSILGTHYFIAPEMRKQGKYDKKIDVWCIGCICMDLMLPKTVDFSFEFLDNSEGIFSKIEKRYSKKVRSFIEKIAIVKPEDRPDCTQLLKMIRDFKKELGLDQKSGSAEGSGNKLLNELNEKEEEIFFLKQNIDFLSVNYSQIQSEIQSDSESNSSSGTGSPLTLFPFMKKAKTLKKGGPSPLLAAKEFKILTNRNKITGTFFDIAFAKWTQTKKNGKVLTVAFKKPKKIAQKKNLEDFKKIVFYDLIKQFENENVEKIYGIVQFKKEYYVVSEAFMFGSLKSYLLNHNYDIRIFQKVQFAFDVLNAAFYLKNQGYVHSNLKSDLICVCDDAKNVKITSLYFAIKLEKVYRDKTEKAILFCFAVILWEIMFRKKYNEEDAFDNIDKNFMPKSEIQKEYVEIINLCRNESSLEKMKHIVYRLGKLKERKWEGVMKLSKTKSHV